MVHAKGTGDYGYFPVYGNIAEFYKGKVSSGPKKGDACSAAVDGVERLPCSNNVTISAAEAFVILIAKSIFTP